jgi:hypothetical protein
MGRINHYNLFPNKDKEDEFWRNCFNAFFKDFMDYDIANLIDDREYGVDVWLNKSNKPIRVGVQLKTQRNEEVNLPYAYKCQSGWGKRMGIYTYTNSPKLDYLIIAYPFTGNCYNLAKSQLKVFWDTYEVELAVFDKFDWERNNECKKYYFSLALPTFLSYCRSAEVEYVHKKVKSI